MTDFNRPDRLPRWGDVTPDETEPSEVLKNTGWLPGRFFRQIQNWLQGKTYEWLGYIDQHRLGTQDLVSGSFRASGFTWSQTAGLTGALSAGVVYLSGERVEFSAQDIVDAGLDSRVFTASRDTYFAVDASGAVEFLEVPNNDPAPTPSAGFVIVEAVVTDGTDITGTNAGLTGDVQKPIQFPAGTLAIKLLSSLLEVTSTAQFKGDIESVGDNFAIIMRNNATSQDSAAVRTYRGSITAPASSADLGLYPLAVTADGSFIRVRVKYLAREVGSDTEYTYGENEYLILRSGGSLSIVEQNDIHAAVVNGTLTVDVDPQIVASTNLNFGLQVTSAAVNTTFICTIEQTILTP